jgi:hypothetical protein
LSPKIKSTLKGRRFEDTEDIKRNVTKELLALHANEFKRCFQQIYDAENVRHLKEIILRNIKRYVRF